MAKSVIDIEIQDAHNDVKAANRKFGVNVIAETDTRYMVTLSDTYLKKVLRVEW